MIQYIVKYTYKSNKIVVMEHTWSDMDSIKEKTNEDENLVL